MTQQERPPRIWPVLIAALAGTVILLWLGVWQVQRLQWKEALLAQLDANAAAAPIDLATAVKQAEEGRDMEFVRVSFPARFRHDGWMKMISTYERGQGWTIITPADTPDGWTVIVDRGRIPGQLVDSFDRPEGEVILDGVLRAHRSGKAYFDPDNDAAANMWYWWDVPAMLAAGGAPGGAKPFPFVVQLLPASGTGGFPKPEEPKAKLANNHLGYAITWFGLAATLIGVAGFYVYDLRKRRRRR
jgi:surfeit locus 1 family protein